MLSADIKTFIQDLDPTFTACGQPDSQTDAAGPPAARTEG
jgi:hypothetical protein